MESASGLIGSALAACLGGGHGLEQRALEIEASDQDSFEGDSPRDRRERAFEGLGEFDVLADFAPDREQECGVPFHVRASPGVIGRNFREM